MKAISIPKNKYEAEEERLAKSKLKEANASKRPDTNICTKEKETANINIPSAKIHNPSDKIMIDDLNIRIWGMAAVIYSFLKHTGHFEMCWHKMFKGIRFSLNIMLTRYDTYLLSSTTIPNRMSNIITEMSILDKANKMKRMVTHSGDYSNIIVHVIIMSFSPSCRFISRMLFSRFFIFDRLYAVPDFFPQRVIWYHCIQKTLKFISINMPGW